MLSQNGKYQFMGPAFFHKRMGTIKNQVALHFVFSTLQHFSTVFSVSLVRELWDDPGKFSNRSLTPSEVWS